MIQLSAISALLTTDEKSALTFLIIVLLVAITIIALLYIFQPGLNVKAKKVGDGQFGNARWITPAEKKKAYIPIKYSPKKWRKGKSLPKKQGVITAVKKRGRKITAYVNTQDQHTGVYAGAGAGKTAFFLYPNLEYACACGMSFFTTDTKGDLYRNYGYIAKEYYGYNVSVLDLRNPTISNGNNILQPVNKYMDIYKDTGDISAKAKAEKYAALIAKNIISSDTSANYGANSYFYDSANGLLTATILLVSEFGIEGERHIPSVFTLLTELLEMVQDGNRAVLKYSKVIKLLPLEHRARLFAIAAVTGSDNTTLSVLTTALSKLTGFLDSEIEQILCFENDIDVEKFCKEKSALFVVLPEEDTTKYFLVSLLLQQFYRECLIYADSIGGKLKNRVMFYLDEIGTIPKIAGLDMMFSASRSRNIFIVPIMQSPSQMADTYGAENAKTINANLATTMYGGFAPENELAKSVSQSLGNVTVVSASVSSSNKAFGDTSSSRSMTSKPLISENELEQLPQGTFIVRRSSTPPMKSKLLLFLKWGITFPGTYIPNDKGVRPVMYLKASDLEERILEKYPYDTIGAEDPAAQGGSSAPTSRLAPLPPEYDLAEEYFSAEEENNEKQQTVTKKNTQIIKKPLRQRRNGFNSN